MTREKLLHLLTDTCCIYFKINTKLTTYKKIIYHMTKKIDNQRLSTKFITFPKTTLALQHTSDRRTDCWV